MMNEFADSWQSWLYDVIYTQIMRYIHTTYNLGIATSLLCVLLMGLYNECFMVENKR